MKVLGATKANRGTGQPMGRYLISRLWPFAHARARQMPNLPQAPRAKDAPVITTRMRIFPDGTVLSGI
jgi:hypothetical protein